MRIALAVGLMLAMAAEGAETSQLLRTRAERGDAKAQGELGVAMMKSKEPAEKKEALTWLRKAAAKNDTNALITIGYELGKMESEVPERNEGYRAYVRAGQLGCGEGFYQAARMVQENIIPDYRARQLVMKDVASTYEKAAGMGSIGAKRALARLYYEGLGVRKDWRTAAKLFEEGKDYGGAAMALREIDVVESYKFTKVNCYLRASVDQQLDSLTKTLSAAQIAEGDRRFKQYVTVKRITPQDNLRAIFKIGPTNVSLAAPVPGKPR